MTFGTYLRSLTLRVSGASETMSFVSMMLRCSAPPAAAGPMASAAWPLDCSSPWKAMARVSSAASASSASMMSFWSALKDLPMAGLFGFTAMKLSSRGSAKSSRATRSTLVALECTARSKALRSAMPTHSTQPCAMRISASQQSQA